MPQQIQLLVQFVLLRALLVQPVSELVVRLLDGPEPPAPVELKQTRRSLEQCLVVVMVADFEIPLPLPGLAG